MPTTTVLFRADAGTDIGLGHLQRSLSLASAFKQLDVASRFFSQTTDEGIRRVDASGFHVDILGNIEPWSLEDAQRTCEIASLNRCKTIVVDSHQVKTGYLSALRNAGLFVVARDDLATCPFPCQMVFNGNSDAHRLPYRSSSGDTVFLLGSDYMVLGKSFETINPGKTRAAVENVLVILGGADHLNLMPRFLRLLDGLPGAFQVTAVVGTFFSNVAAVESVAGYSNKPVRLVHSPTGTYDLMLEADLAISAAGQTLYELACVGCPTVAVGVAPNQQGHLKTLEAAGVLISAGDAERDDVIPGAGQALSTLLTDQTRRAEMSAAGRRAVDGKGAERVARRILAEVGV